jgi:hypothetical protein
MKLARSIWWIVLTALVSACGGDGSGGGASGPPPAPLTGVSIAYQSTSYVFAPGVVAQTLQPTVTGGVTLTNWSVNPALPAGLTLAPTTGDISGLPTAATPAGNYTITASNAQGHVSTTLTISIAGTTLLNLGLGSQVSLIRYANTSVLSQDTTGAWVLQDFASGSTLAYGIAFNPNDYSYPGTYVDLENNVMIDIGPAATTLEVRSATTGQLLASITNPAERSCNMPVSNCQVNWYRLATDGSYVVGGTATALTAWSTAGETLFSIAGDYALTSTTSPQPFAAPGQVQIANGPAGANVIQTITVPGGVSSMSPAFQGNFSSWFADGQSFLSTLGNTVFTYSAAGVKLDVTAIIADPTMLGGSGNWFWVCDDTNGASIYKVGSSASPALTTGPCGPNSAVSGKTLGLLGDYSLTVIDLSGTTLSSTSYSSIPFASQSNFLNGFAAESATKWLVGNDYGVVLDGSSLSGTPRSLTLGAALSIAAGTSYISVATASGEILFFNSSNDTVAGTITFPAYQLAASSNGAILAAYADGGPSTNSTLNVYSLPSGALINSFSYTAPSVASNVGLSGSGTVLAETFKSPSTECLLQVLAVAGGSPIVCENSTSDVNVQLSPSGALAATSPGPYVDVSTNIYNNSTLVTAVPGYAVGWLDNNNLLLNTFTEPGENLQGNGMTIVNASGTQVGMSPVLSADTLEIVPGSTSVYDLDRNAILSLSTGSTLWAYGSETSFGLTGPNAGLTASQVILVSDSLVLAVPY